MGKSGNILPAGEIDQQQGFADKKFDAALQQLVAKNVIPGFLIISRNSTIDKEGIDRLIILPGGLTVAVQIKPKHPRHHFNKKILRHLELYPLIVCIFGIERRESVRRLARRIIRKINKMIRKTQELSMGNAPSEALALKPPL